jgi:hypothetical protein
VTAFFRRALRGCFVLALCVSAASCGGGDTVSSNGGGGGVAAANNVVDVAVTSGPSGANSINVLYTTVTVCLPGTSTCQTIDNIQVDTGSYGLRILAPVWTIDDLPGADARQRQPARRMHLVRRRLQLGPGGPSPT